jgi:hypothetical protein
MPARRFLAAAFALMVSLGSGAAGELAAFHRAIETFSAHNRVAIGYLRTGNFDLAAAELDAMRETWSAFVERFGNDRPPEFRDNPRYVTSLVDVPTRLVGVQLMLTMGRTDLAGDALTAVRKELSALRRSSDVEVLADCILDVNTAMEQLIAYRDQPPDWGSSSAVADLANAAETYGAGVRRCDAMASDEVRRQPEFRRLVDGVAASLAQMPSAIAARDGDLLHRLLIELRSFDNLLAFRYG